MKKLCRLIAVALAAGSPAALSAQSQNSLTPSTTSESISGGTLLLAAYAVAWIVVLLYVLMLWRKTTRVARELADVNAKLAARSAKR